MRDFHYVMGKNMRKEEESTVTELLFKHPCFIWIIPRKTI